MSDSSLLNRDPLERPDPSDLYVGLMSGTSMDGIDAALVRFGDRSCDIVATVAASYPNDLRAVLVKASRAPHECTIDQIGELDSWIGECFRDAANTLLSKSGTDPAMVRAIGSHGQTIRHQPNARRPFTMQIGDPNIIVTGTGLTTVADFRRRDIAVGGEGAPLAPAFHHWLFGRQNKTRCVLNIGGIANVTVLSGTDRSTIGFDTGPGNTLLDGWIQKNLGKTFDENGAWATSGKVSDALLNAMSADAYFELRPPKSTGFEYFDDAWVQSHVTNTGNSTLTPADVQATLAELSASTIANAILQTALDFEDFLFAVVACTT